MKTPGKWICPKHGEIKLYQVRHSQWLPSYCDICSDFVTFIEHSDQLELFPEAQPSYSPANQLAGDS